MEKTGVATEKRAKTSINLKQSLRNAAIKHLIDLTGETEVSKAVEMALELWLSGKQPSTTDDKGLLQIVAQPTKVGSGPVVQIVSHDESECVFLLLRILRSESGKYISYAKKNLEALAAFAVAENPSVSRSHSERRSESHSKPREIAGGTKSTIRGKTGSPRRANGE